MDLGTIQSKLEGGRYSAAGQVWEDIRLVWRNCRTFNEPSSDVYKDCEELSGFIEEIWRQARLDRGGGQVRSAPRKIVFFRVSKGFGAG